VKRLKLQDLSVDQLLERFTAIALEQDQAVLMDEIARFNKLFDQMDAVKKELRSRSGDQRRALLALYDHPNIQVRLKAAVGTLAVEPESARKLLQSIADSREYPQAADAGMTLGELDRGIFKPT
jgi:ribosomal protein L29